MCLLLNDICKSFGSTAVLDNLNLKVEQGEFHVLLGPSGEGKTVLLSIIAGLLEPDSGSLEIGYIPMKGVPAEERLVSMVFQDLAVFPHLDVTENIAFGLRAQGTSERETRQIVDYMLKLTKLTNFRRSMPGSLSGGQLQRVALARALAVKPDLLLLDEPLSHLDSVLKETLMKELKQIQQETGVTMLYVTHSRDEAAALADRVSILHSGRIEQTGCAADLLYRPRSRFVSEFLHTRNVLDCNIAFCGDNEVILDVDDPSLDKSIQLEMDYFPVFRKRRNISVCLDARKLILTNEPKGQNVFPATIVKFESLGSLTHAVIDVYGCELNVKLPKTQLFLNEKTFYVSIPPASIKPLCGRPAKRPTCLKEKAYQVRSPKLLYHHQPNHCALI